MLRYGSFYFFMWTTWAMEGTSIQSEATSDNPSPWLASEFKRVTLNCASFKNNMTRRLCNMNCSWLQVKLYLSLKSFRRSAALASVKNSGFWKKRMCTSVSFHTMLEKKKEFFIMRKLQSRIQYNTTGNKNKMLVSFTAVIDPNSFITFSLMCLRRIWPHK